MSILIDQEKKLFKLDTANMSYVVGVLEEGFVVCLHYGAPVADADLFSLVPQLCNASFSAVPADALQERTPDTLLLEYSGDGTADRRPCSIAALDAQGDNVLSLRYVTHQLVEGKPDNPGLPHTYLNEGDQAQTLIITQRDAINGVVVDMYYTIFQGSDALVRWNVVRNEGALEVDLTRVMSATLSFPDMNYEFAHLHGSWAREFQMERVPIGHTTQSVGSVRGSSSHLHNPFAAIVEKGAGEDNGNVYGISLVYSSNFIIETDADSFNQLRVNVGIHDRGFRWHLAPGESFATPEAVLVYSGTGLGAMSRTYHKLYRRNLARGKFRDTVRPVLINTWEGVYFDFNREKLMTVARSAAKLGIELFVLDDGWFGARDNDWCALGDWVVNEKKLGCSLHTLVEDVKSTGMNFGIWFEPEMISPNSDLYRAHPDWCLRQKKHAPSLGRHQLILDMSRTDVQQYVIDAVAGVLSSADIRYVKWDMNRNMAEIGSAQLPNARLGELYHRYICGVYAVMEELINRFPHVLFESCSGGGGRLDPGILYYMPQAWNSDDSDAIERLKIQNGASMVYPPSSWTCHVSAVPNHQVARMEPLHTRGNVAMQGSFGYELDMSKMTQEENEQVTRQIQDYKRYGHLVMQGDLYRLISPMNGSNESAWMVVAQDGSCAILTYVKILNTPNPAVTRIRLAGLDQGAKYRNTQTGEVFAGATLMGAGLNMKKMDCDFDSVRIILERV